MDRGEKREAGASEPGEDGSGWYKLLDGKKYKVSDPEQMAAYQTAWDAKQAADKKRWAEEDAAEEAAKSPEQKAKELRMRAQIMEAQAEQIEAQAEQKKP